MLIAKISLKTQDVVCVSSEIYILVVISYQNFMKMIKRLGFLGFLKILCVLCVLCGSNVLGQTKAVWIRPFINANELIRRNEQKSTVTFVGLIGDEIQGIAQTAHPDFTVR